MEELLVHERYMYIQGRFSKITQTQAHRSMSLPVLTYDARRWSLTDFQKSKFKVCQRVTEQNLVSKVLTKSGT